MNAAFAAVMPPAEKLVMLKFCDHANDDGIAWPSVAKLAQAACISERQAQRVMKRLAAEGYLEIVGNEKGGAGNSRVYRVKRERFLSPLERGKGDKMTPQKGDNMSGQNDTLSQSKRVTPEAQKGDILTKKGDIAMSQKGDTAMSPESSRTPILKSNPHRTTSFPAGENSPTDGADETAFQSACKQTWLTYSTAYQDRYQTPPVRNATVNSCVREFVKRIGQEEAPRVAEFYVWVNDQYLIRNGHPFQILTKNAEGYRTQWATGRAVTGTQARQIEKTASNKSAADEAKEILRNRQATGQAYRSAVAEQAIKIARGAKA